MDSVREDLALAREQLRISEAARLQLQDQMRQNAHEAQELGEKNSKFNETLINENKRLEDELNKIRHEKAELERDVGQKSITIQILTERNLHLSA